jgi:hypothetical protein
MARAIVEAPSTAPAEVAIIFRRDIPRVGFLLIAEGKLRVFILVQRIQSEFWSCQT